MRRVDRLLTVLVLMAFAVAPSVRALQEHPQEHPQKEHSKKEHPAAKPVTKATLERAIRKQIDEKAKASGGKFEVQDDVLNKTWNLALVRIHTDKLTQLDPHTYFACVDFRADDGTMLDVDFYLKDEHGKLRMTDTTVHKVSGKPRFNYQQKGNFWERVKTSS